MKTEAFAEMYRPYGSEVEQKVIDYHESHGGISRYEKFKVYHGEYLNLAIDDQKVQELADRFSSLVLEKVVNADYVPGCFHLPSPFMTDAVNYFAI